MPTLAPSLTDREQRLCGLIGARARPLLDDLRLHVGTPTGGNNKVALDETRERFVARLQKLGAATKLVPGDPKPDWLHGVTPGGHVPPTAVCGRVNGHDSARGARVVIAGHLDTVHDPDGSFRELTIAPDGKMATGPGCVDMKGGLVILIAALEALEEAGIDAAWTVVLNGDEETGSYHSERAIRAAAREHDVGLAVEPAMPGGELAVERLGSGQFLIETHGRSAHVGRDFEKGVSAVTALGECLARAGHLSEPSRGMIVNIGPLEGGNATNVVPDLARAWGNVRFPDKRIADELGAKLDALATPEDAMPRVTVRKSFIRAAKPLTPGTKRLAELARDAAESLGQKLPFGKTGGVCDGNILQDEGLPTIDTLGVRGGGLHTPQEWIELPSLVERCQLLAVVLSRLAGGAMKS
ncbi:MAG: M20/M25/M40 family metallo-hydrolase [Phycisphaerales bacterium]